MLADALWAIVIFFIKVVSKHFPYIYTVHTKLPHTSLFAQITL